MEDPEFIAYAVADGGHLQRRQGIDEAGGQSAKSAVAQARFLFLLQQFIEIQAQFAHALLEPDPGCRD